MASIRTPDPRAGGALLALCVMAGAVIGTVKHQPTIGFLVGAGVGIVLAVAAWLLDRRR